MHEAAWPFCWRYQRPLPLENNLSTLASWRSKPRVAGSEVHNEGVICARKRGRLSLRRSETPTKIRHGLIADGRSPECVVAVIAVQRDTLAVK